MSMGALRSAEPFLAEDEACTHSEAIDRCLVLWPHRWSQGTIQGARTLAGHMVVERMPEELDRLQETVVSRAMPPQSATFKRSPPPAS